MESAISDSMPFLAISGSVALDREDVAELDVLSGIYRVAGQDCFLRSSFVFLCNLDVSGSQLLLDLCPECLAADTHIAENFMIVEYILGLLGLLAVAVEEQECLCSGFRCSRFFCCGAL